MKELMLTNHAVARGAYEAGVRVLSAYPGTPSTEIAESFVKYDGVYAEWAPNEKVALEVAVGASVAGARAMACMKHVGVNVAADPLFTSAYTGVNGGLVIVVADDPGMHSSQNEQDSRFYARSAHVMMLEPSDAQEAKDFTKLAFELSEKYDTPVFIRLTTRVAHSRSLVELCDREDVKLRPYEKSITKYTMMPASAILRHQVVEERDIELANMVNTLDINKVERSRRGNKIGVVCSGVVYQYVKEALPDASIFKVGTVYPLPIKAIEKFATTVQQLYVIEELEPYIENQLKKAGIKCKGKEIFSLQGELSVLKILEKFNRSVPVPVAAKVPGRPPVMCAGCPHRGVFYVLGKLKLTVNGDIGCYTLGAVAPLSAVDTVLCMGASIGMAHGFKKATKGVSHNIAVIGDSVNTARYAGMNVGWIIMRTMFISGAICGIVGFIIVSGANFTLYKGVANGVGFTSITVAWLSQLNSFAMIVISMILAILEKGANTLQTRMQVPASIADIITGILLFCMLSCEFFINYSLIFRHKVKEEAKA